MQLTVFRARRQDSDSPGDGAVVTAPFRSRLLRRPRREGGSGQSLVEFALVLPLFFTMLTGVIEFGFAANAFLGINRASQDAAGLAGQLGSTPGADCLILRRVESLVGTPTDGQHIDSVRIHRTTPSGTTVYATNAYTRQGTTVCTLADGTTVTVPYSTGDASSYPESDRCAVLRGCPELGASRDTVDTIAVEVTYRHRFLTPLGGMLGILGADEGDDQTWTFQHRNTVRMEPVL